METQILVDLGKDEYQDAPGPLKTKKKRTNLQIAGKLMKSLVKSWKIFTLRFQINFSRNDHPAYYHGETFTPDQIRAKILPYGRQSYLH